MKVKKKKNVNMLFDNILYEGHIIITTNTSCKWYEGKIEVKKGKVRMKKLSIFGTYLVTLQSHFVKISSPHKFSDL